MSSLLMAEDDAQAVTPLDKNVTPLDPLDVDEITIDTESNLR